MRKTILILILFIKCSFLFAGNEEVRYKFGKGTLIFNKSEFTFIYDSVYKSDFMQNEIYGEVRVEKKEIIFSYVSYYSDSSKVFSHLTQDSTNYIDSIYVSVLQPNHKPFPYATMEFISPYDQSVILSDTVLSKNGKITISRKELKTDLTACYVDFYLKNKNMENIFKSRMIFHLKNNNINCRLTPMYHSLHFSYKKGKLKPKDRIEVLSKWGKWYED